MVTYIGAADAARRLGVKPATLYAYVSRGTLRRERSADGRTSLFDADEIEKLARRGRPRRPEGALDLTVESLLSTADDPSSAARVVGDVLRRGERIPGFGHTVYKVEDPRGRLLLDLVRRAAPGSRKVTVADAIIAEVRRRALPEPNIDFALGTLTSTAGMDRGAGETIFAIARTAGWTAHALEAYEAGTMLRPRASYTGRSAS